MQSKQLTDLSIITLEETAMVTKMNLIYSKTQEHLQV